MRVPTRHPSEATLLCYAAGALDKASAAVVDRHMAVCPECRAAVDFGRKIRDAAFSPRPASPDEHAGRPEPDAATRTKRPGAFICINVTDEWKLSPLLPGCRIKPILQEGRHKLQLVHLDPCTRIAAHAHEGLELLMVLEGTLGDGPKRYREGDVLEADGETVHSPRALNEAACTYLMAIEGNNHYRGKIGSLIFRMLGI